MTKINRTISIDYELWENLRSKGINISGEINNMLRALVSPKEIGEQIDDKLLEKKIKIERNLINKSSILLKDLEGKKEQIVKSLEHKEEEQLKKIKEQEKKKVFCLKCGQEFHNRSKMNYNDGFIHLQCFENLPKEEQKEVLKKYNEGVVKKNKRSRKGIIPNKHKKLS